MLLNEYCKMDLAVNKGKIKCMLSISSDVLHIDFQITTNNYTLGYYTRNLFALVPPLPQKMMSVWGQNLGSWKEGCIAAGRNPLIGLLWPIK